MTKILVISVETCIWMRFFLVHPLLSSESNCHLRVVIFRRVLGVLPLHERKGTPLSTGAFREAPQKKDTCFLGIGNGVGKQGRGNQPPYRRYGPNTEIQYRLRKPHGLAKPSRILSKREADTEFQYRPHIVNTDIDCGRHFCGCHFRDSYVWPCIHVAGVTEQVSSSCRCKPMLRSDSPVHRNLLVTSGRSQ